MSVTTNKRQWIKEVINSVENGSSMCVSHESFLSILRFLKKNSIQKIHWRIDIETNGDVVINLAF